MMQASVSLLIALAFVLVIQENVSASPFGNDKEKPPKVSVEFLVAGRPLPQQGRRYGETYVTVPRWGVEYEIKIENHDPHDRVLFVIGVDGLSVMDGSGVSQHSGGYVLEPGGSGRIRGWRRGDDKVAAFTFTGKGDSYAGRTGRPGNIGEIWVWAIREKSCRPTPKAATRAGKSRKKAGTDAARSYHSQSETGTGYGEELADHVRTTAFRRSSALRRLNFRYGLSPVVKPSRRSGSNYSPPPRGWKKGAR
jgi:hypothetical protein